MNAKWELDIADNGWWLRPNPDRIAHVWESNVERILGLTIISGEVKVHEEFKTIDEAKTALAKIIKGAK
jgi:hypothetical protein